MGTIPGFWSNTGTCSYYKKFNYINDVLIIIMLALYGVLLNSNQVPIAGCETKNNWVSLIIYF